MGWLNVIKGAYPSVDMVTQTLPISASETGEVVRGSAVVIGSDNCFRLGVYGDGYTAGTIGKIVFWALQGAENYEAQAAGSVSQPVIAGLPCTFPLEIETDQYLESKATGAITYNVGDFLQVGAYDGGAVGAGKVAPKVDKGTAIGVVTRAPYRRWVNSATAVENQRTGNNVNVIRFITVYAPVLTNAS